MKIGEVAKMLDINSSAIRFFERRGLLSFTNISRAENGYGIYSHSDIEELRLLIRL